LGSAIRRKPTRGPDSDVIPGALPRLKYHDEGGYVVDPQDSKRGYFDSTSGSSDLDDDADFDAIIAGTAAVFAGGKAIYDRRRSPSGLGIRTRSHAGTSARTSPRSRSPAGGKTTPRIAKVAGTGAALTAGKLLYNRRHEVVHHTGTMLAAGKARYDHERQKHNFPHVPSRSASEHRDLRMELDDLPLIGRGIKCRIGASAREAMGTSGASAVPPSDKAMSATDTSPATSWEQPSTQTITNDPDFYGWTREHVLFGPRDEDMLQTIHHLGQGSLSVVEEVRCTTRQYPSFVRKRVTMPVSRQRAAAYRKIVQEEARILSSLVHPHIVTFIGSYEDVRHPGRPSYCLLMAPVGEGNLEELLTILDDHSPSSEISIRWRNCLRSWMVCLPAALEYMHASGTRHQDIKPSNIVYKGEQVFFTDFSSSAEFQVGHTTSTDSPARSTPMYCAPEESSGMTKHGTTTDVFSLGCVLSDILTAVEGRKVSDFRNYLRHDGQPPTPLVGPDRQELRYSGKIQFISEWFVDSSVFEVCIAPMLHVDRQMRPAATNVVQMLLSNHCGNHRCSCVQAQGISMSNAVAPAE
jgi:serine/threonine protein kinase